MLKPLLVGTPNSLRLFMGRCQEACRQRYGQAEGDRRFRTLSLIDALHLLSN